MGLFNKKPNTQKTYTAKGAKAVILAYPNYTAIPIGIDEFKIAREVDVRYHIDQYKSAGGFKERINGNGEFNNIQIPRYQATKRNEESLDDYEIG